MRVLLVPVEGFTADHAQAVQAAPTPTATPTTARDVTLLTLWSILPAVASVGTWLRSAGVACAVIGIAVGFRSGTWTWPPWRDFVSGRCRWQAIPA